MLIDVLYLVQLLEAELNATATNYDHDHDDNDGDYIAALDINHRTRGSAIKVVSHRRGCNFDFVPSF